MDEQIQKTHQTILRLNQVKERVGLSRTSIYRLMRRGEFPSAVKITPRAIGWLNTSVDAWIDAQVKQSSAK